MTIEKAWFLNENEIQMLISHFKKKINLPIGCKEIILSNYNNVMASINSIKIEDVIICPNCKEKLVKEKYGRYYICPNYPKECAEGCIRQNKTVENPTLGIFDIQEEKTKGWISRLEKDLKDKEFKLTRAQIYKFLSDEKKITPQVYIKQKTNREYLGGWNKSRLRSKEIEEVVEDNLKKEYPNTNIFSQKWIGYKINEKIQYCRPDFIVYKLDNSILIVEVKNYKWIGEKEKLQLELYKKLLRIIYPEKNILSCFYVLDYDKKEIKKLGEDGKNIHN